MIDLHLHSRYSDGALTPAKLVERAADKGVTALALTDHDNCAGNPEAAAAGRELGVQVIAGVEFSVQLGELSIHLLGYGVDDVNERARRALAFLEEGRNERLRKMVSRLNDRGIPISSAEVLAHAGDGVVGRLHLARALTSRGAVSTVRDAFTKYLGRGGSAYVERPRLGAAEAIELIHSMGGVAVLAHPGVLERSGGSDLEKIIDTMTAMGMDGIEAYYTSHRPEQVALYRLLAKERGLITTGGSDFHRADPGGPEIGTGSGKLKVPPEVLDSLKEAIAAQRDQ